MSDTAYQAPDLLGSTYLYSDSFWANTSFCFVAGLTMAVDMDILGQALDGLMPRFPHIDLKAVRDGESLAFAKRNSPVRVLPASERACFAESGTFGKDCMFAVFTANSMT